MRIGHRIRHHVALMATVSGIAGVLVGMGASPGAADPCSDPVRQADLSVALKVTPVSTAEQAYTVTVVNGGPSCAPGASAVLELPASSTGVTAVTPNSWSCSGIGSTTVTCQVRSTISAPPSSSNFATVVVRGAPSPGPASVTVSSTPPDPDGSNNVSSGAFGTTLTVEGSETVTVSRPDEAAIIVQQLTLASLSVPVPPPDCPTCTSDLITSIATPAVPNAQFKSAPLTFTWILFTSSRTKSEVWHLPDGGSAWEEVLDCKGGRVNPCKTIRFTKAGPSLFRQVVTVTSTSNGGWRK